MNQDAIWLGFFILFVVIVLFYAYLWSKMPNPCKHTTTIKLSSIQKQKCADCYKMIDWPLKDGQQPLVSSSRDKRKK